jgi:hypothetical protein
VPSSDLAVSIGASGESGSAPASYVRTGSLSSRNVRLDRLRALAKIG